MIDNCPLNLGEQSCPIFQSVKANKKVKFIFAAFFIIFNSNHELTTIAQNDIFSF